MQKDLNVRSGRMHGMHIAFWLAAGFAVFLIAGFWANGCSRNPYIIPVQQDAQAQFVYAANLEKAFRSPLARKQRDENFAKAVAGYQKVIDAFPEDKRWPPRAELKIAMMQDTYGEDKKALRTYERLIRDYPNDEDIQINALYGAAVIYDESGKYDRAQKYFSEITGRFSKSSNPAYQRIARQALFQSQKTRKK